VVGDAEQSEFYCVEEARDSSPVLIKRLGCSRMLDVSLFRSQAVVYLMFSSVIIASLFAGDAPVVSVLRVPMHEADILYD
jgi:hypothetical protein